MSIINDIYAGDVYPAEQVKPDSELFKLHSANVEALAQKLADALTDEQQETLDAYKSEQAMTTDLYNMEFYRAGVRFGIQFLLDALGLPSDLTDIHK